MRILYISLLALFMSNLPAVVQAQPQVPFYLAYFLNDASTYAYKGEQRGENEAWYNFYDVTPSPLLLDKAEGMEEASFFYLGNFLDKHEGVLANGNTYVMDSLWFSLHKYYKVWDPYKANPYQVEWKNIQQIEETTLQLYYPEQNISFAIPLDSLIVTSDFGLRRARWHNGVDLRLAYRQKVKASFDGVVRISSYQRRGMGHYVLIRHYNGLETLYGHLSRRAVKVGDKVKAGDMIGYGGSTGRSTGPHLHYEIRYKGYPIDPNNIFDFQTACLKDMHYVLSLEDFSYLTEANSIRVHRIRRGQTLSHISYRYGVSINKLCALNGMRRNSVLRIGQSIRVN